MPQPPPADAEDTDDKQAITAWLDGIDATTVSLDVSELLKQLREDGRRLKVARLPLGPGAGAPSYFVVSGRWRRRSAVDADADTGTDDGDSESSFTGAEVTLSAHQAGVESLAVELARRASLPADVVADLGLAGRWHDAGKADGRFQRWLHDGSEFKALVQPEPLAKSSGRPLLPSARRQARERAGYPSGARHELMSVALMSAAGGDLSSGANDWVLVQHLVAVHHGFCRPLAPWIPDPSPTAVTYAADGLSCAASSDHGLARLDSGIVDRFWAVIRHYGWWGSAWLEAIFRLADHIQSGREQRTREERRDHA